MKLISQKVLIKLDEQVEHTDTGILIPLYEKAQTDGDRPTVKLSNKKYLSQGTVVEVSSSALEHISKDATLKPGDRVYVNPQAVSPTYQYFTDRSKLVIDFDGHVLIPVQLIDAIL